MRTLLLVVLLLSKNLRAKELVFQVDSKDGIAKEWKWIREDSMEWRSASVGLDDLTPGLEGTASGRGL